MKRYVKTIMALSMTALISVSAAAGTGIKINAQSVQNNQTYGDNNLGSKITDMNLKGFVGEKLKGNVKNWQLVAYKNNKNIIDQIAAAKTNELTFSYMLGSDYFNVESYLNMDIMPYGDKQALGFVMTSAASSFGDRDVKYDVDPNAITNWSGATELWVEVDASNLESDAYLRISFEENSFGRESYRPLTGKEFTLYTSDGQALNAKTEEGGYSKIEAGFKGYVALPLGESFYERYFDNFGNGMLDIDKVVQWQISYKSDSKNIDKPFYITSFNVVGNVDGKTVPFATDAGDKILTIWNFDGIKPKTDVDMSSLFWYGEFVGKLLTGIAYGYMATNDRELKAVADGIVDDLSAAQGEDGYLGTYIGKSRYSLETNNWDLWNQYHCITGLLEWYKITGNEKAFITAKKCIDCIYETFKNRSYLVFGGYETNRSIAHAYAQMYQATRDKKYLDEAERIISEDCNQYNGWYNYALQNIDFYKTNCGRWEVLHMIMTLGILYEETWKPEYYEVMKNVWESIDKTDVHNDGGFATNEGALGDPYMDGVIETCCTVAWMAFTNEYYKYNQSVEVADELERSYYNAMLGSLMEGNKYCTYNTPVDGVQGSCGGYDGRRVSSQQDISFQYNKGSSDFNCCQANLARGLGQISQWAAVTFENELNLNYFGACEIETEVGGKKVIIKEQTNYPLDGNVRITIDGLSKNDSFTLNIRIPTWAKGATAKLNGEYIDCKSGEYLNIERVWENGDEIQLDLPMEINYWVGENVKSGRTSVYYGPILLALDNYFAPSYNNDTEMTTNEIESAQVTSGGLYGALLFVDIKKGQDTIRLVDFASAGKYRGNSSPSTYWSWLNVTDAPSIKSYENPVYRWQNNDRKRITASYSVVLDKYSAYAGQMVNFSVKKRVGYDAEVALSGGVTFTNKGNEYSFVMGENDVDIQVTYTKKQEQSTSGKGCSSTVGTQSAVLSACAVAALGLKRKRKIEE